MTSIKRLFKHNLKTRIKYYEVPPDITYYYTPLRCLAFQILDDKSVQDVFAEIKMIKQGNADISICRENVYRRLAFIEWN